MQIATLEPLLISFGKFPSKELAGKLKNVLATYNEAEDLINIGAYKNGSNKNIDYAIRKIDAVNDFLTQKTDEKFQFEEEINLLRALFQD